MNFSQKILVLAFFIYCPIIAWGHDGGKGINDSAPPNIGAGGPFNSRNVTLLSHMNLGQIGGGPTNVLGNDCWGWTDPLTSREYAIFGLTNGTSFIDITDPTAPIYLGKLNSQTGNTAWRDMKVYNNHAFIVSDANGAHGMQVFDLTQLRTVAPNNPQSFTNTAHYAGVNSSHNIAINEATGFAYIVGSNQASGGLHIVNIQNPTNPVAAGNFAADGYTLGLPTSFDFFSDTGTGEHRVKFVPALP
jgi:choice-of-anchor B domain-containing protein